METLSPSPEGRTKPADVAVVGGGVIGLSIAYVLAREGLATIVVDRDRAGRGTSWAGAGMIPPYPGRRPGSPMTVLRSWGAELHRDWSLALLDETGIDNGYRKTGGIDVAHDDLDESALKTAAGRWRAEGIDHLRLDRSDLLAIEPTLGPSLRLGYFLPDRAQIRSPRHLRALELASTRRGVVFLRKTEVFGLVRSHEGRVVGVETSRGRIGAGTIVLAAGAWTGRLVPTIPTPPLKGEIVLLRHDGQAPSRIIERGKNYLVPRDDGRLLAGATEEEAGFDLTIGPEATRRLIAEAVLLCPALASAEVETSWAGLRPGSLDTRPYLGPLPGSENVIIASGHKRAGIQLAPSTAEVVADLVLGRPPRVDLDPFRPGRPASGGDDPGFRS